MQEFLQRINWIDIAAAILFARICYISLKRGFSEEIFKFLGCISSVYIPMHYYPAISDFFSSKYDFGKGTGSFFDFLAFCFLAGITYGIFVLLEHLFSQMIKLDAAPLLNRYGGLLLGLMRAFLTVSLVFIILFLSNADYFRASINESFCGRRLMKVSINTYAWMWDNIGSKFFASEKINSAVLDLTNPDK